MEGRGGEHGGGRSGRPTVREGGGRGGGEVDCFQLGLEYKLANYSEIR